MRLCAPAPARQPNGRGGAERGVAQPHLIGACSPAAAMDVGAADFARCLPCLQDRVGRAAFLGERCVGSAVWPLPVPPPSGLLLVGALCL